MVLTMTEQTQTPEQDTWLTRWLNGINWASMGESSDFFYCRKCGCLLLPSEINGNPYINGPYEETYLDRYIYAGQNQDDYSDCPCHLTPKCIRKGTEVLTWLTVSTKWGCEPAHNMDYMVCRDCDRKAVAFLNPGYRQEHTSVEAYWACENHLGVSVSHIDVHALLTNSSGEEPAALRLLRESVEVATALSYETR